MGALSNQLLVVTIVLYIFAMLAYAVEYSFGRRSAVARVAERSLVTVGAPSPVTSTVTSTVEPVTEDSPASPQSALAGRAGQVAVGLTLLGVALHVATVVTRGVAAGRAPWGNLYEFVLAITVLGMLTWLVVLSRAPQLRHLGLFVTLAVALLLSVDGMKYYTPAGPLMPALQSYWLLIHVTAASLAAGILLVGFVFAALHLTRLRYDAGKGTLGERLPTAEVLERLTFRVHAFAFPVWTFAIICGAIWAEAAWGRYWNWDPKETWSFVAWVVYACYLHARSTPSVSRRITSWIAVAGWVAMLFNLVGVNFLLVGFHSYAGAA